MCDLKAIREERERLLVMKSRLEEQRKQMLELRKDPDPTACAYGSEDEQISRINLRLIQLIDAEEALSKGEAGTICSGCKKPIPKERLEAMPTAIRCVRCQEIQDRKKKIPIQESHPGSGHRKQEVGPAYGCSI